MAQAIGAEKVKRGRIIGKVANEHHEWQVAWAGGICLDKGPAQRCFRVKAFASI